LTGTAAGSGTLVPVVDVADTTMAASGTDKSMTLTNLAQAVGYNGRLILDGAVPSAPASGVAMFSHPIANRPLPGYINSSGVDTPMQAHLGQNSIFSFKAMPGQTTLTGHGLSLTATGTATTMTLASTNLATSSVALEMAVTTASTTAVGGWRVANSSAGLFLWLGNAAGLGGFTYVCRFRTPRAWPSTQRCFVGISSSTSAPTDVQPSSLTNLIGVGFDAADSTWQVIYNGAGSATKTNTSITRPASDNQLLELQMFSAPNSGTVYVTFNELVGNTTFSTNLTTNLPSTTTFMQPYAYRSVGGTSSTIGLSIASLYVETDS
jgi:hypothetical protein